jgi:hypothetical protein
MRNDDLLKTLKSDVVIYFRVYSTDLAEWLKQNEKVEKLIVHLQTGA